MFQPRAALRGLVAAFGRSGLEIGGRPSQCGPYREPDLSWAALRVFRDLGTACGFFGQKLRYSAFSAELLGFRRFLRRHSASFSGIFDFILNF